MEGPNFAERGVLVPAECQHPGLLRYVMELGTVSLYQREREVALQIVTSAIDAHVLLELLRKGYQPAVTRERKRLVPYQMAQRGHGLDMVAEVLGRLAKVWLFVVDN